MRHVKVNFPKTRDEFEQGFGEGMWVIVDDATHARVMDDGCEGEVLAGTLDNDSIERPELKHGAPVRFETRGPMRPVALLA